VVGLGAAGRSLFPFLEQHPAVRLVAGVDPDPAAREAFGGAGREAYADLDEMLAADVDVVYVASPTPLHPEHVLRSLEHGKHVVVEKPMAPSVADAEAMVRAAERAGRVFLVGHSQSFEAPVRAIRALVESGAVGAVRAVNAWYFTDWMYRPRHPDELDAAKGGGVPLRQGAHHADIIRFIGGGLLRSVRGRVGCWDPDRRADGAYTAYLEFEDGTPATAVYSGYDHFPSTELTFGISESGRLLQAEYAVARRRLAAAGDPEAELALKRGAGGASRQHEMLAAGDLQPFFGLVVVSCERADIRVSPSGLTVYGDQSRDEVSLARWPAGRRALLDELVGAVRGTAPATHDGRWGLANLEVCAALVESSQERREVLLSRQVALPPQRAEAPALATPAGR
jgi:phthalate 4,5-cis-dihydrodiol dehydrogenase